MRNRLSKQTANNNGGCLLSPCGLSGVWKRGALANGRFPSIVNDKTCEYMCVLHAWLQIQLKFAQFSKLENWRIERETEVTGKGASTDNGKSLSRAKNRFMNLRKFTNYSVCQGLPLLNYKKRIDLIFVNKFYNQV